MALQFRRGTAAERLASTIIPEVGEPWFTYDDGQLYVGDGVAVGGVNVGANVDLELLADVYTIKEDVGTILSYSITSNVATVILTLDHSYYIDLIIDIADSSVTALNGTHTVTGIVGGNGFTFDLTASDVVSTATDGTVTPQIPANSIIRWNQTTERWEDGLPVLAIGDLSDVDLETTPVSDNDILQYDSTSSSFKPVGHELGNVNDVNGTYLTDTTPVYRSPYLGKVLKYDYNDEWTPYRPGETIIEDPSTNYFGTDFLPNYTDVYESNASVWDLTADFAGVNDGITYPNPPYGGSLTDGILYFEPLVQPTSTSTDFTLDFWAYRNSTGTNFPTEIIKVWGGSSSSSYEMLTGYYVQNGFYITSASPSNNAFGVKTVRTWTISGDSVGAWHHFRICRSGSTWRLWFDGASQGSGTAGSGATSSWIFDWDQLYILNLADIPNTGQTDVNLVGPVYFDMRQAISSVTASSITVPTSRVGENLYQVGSGVDLGDLEDVDLETTAPSDGDALVYDNASQTWIAGAVAPPIDEPLQAQFYYRMGTAPTGVVTSSNTVGRNYGTWTEATFANAAVGWPAPASTLGDPTLTGITFNSSTGAFSNFPAGRYIVSYNLSLIADNVTPSFYTSPPALFSTGVAYSAAGDLYFDLGLMQLLPYTSYGSAPAYFYTSGTVDIVFTDTTPANNEFIIAIDQDQGPSYYVDIAVVNFTRIAGL